MMPGSRITSWLARKPNIAMVLVMAVSGVLNIALAERLTVGNGFGWDGLTYASWVYNFYQRIFVDGVSAYYVQRIVPPAVVHYGMRLLGIPFTDTNIIQSFEVYNLLLLLVATWTWGLIADHLALSVRGKWFGFCCLFVNYAMLKSNYYQPVLTDTTAFVLGIVLCYCFLANRPVGLLATLVVGAFTWPTLVYEGLLLFLLPYRREGPGRATPSLWDRSPLRAVRPNLVLGALVSVGMLLFFQYALRVPGIPFKTELYDVNIPLMNLSVAAVMAYLFFGLSIAAADRRLFDPRALLRAFAWRRVPIAVGLVLALRFVTEALATDARPESTLGFFVTYSAVVSFTNPLIFVVGHVVYFGPAILLLLFWWRPFCALMRRYGLGLQLFVLFITLFSINSQSRFWLNAVPLFIVLLVQLVDRAGWSNRQYALWAALSLLFSKVWYTFNTAPQVYTDRQSLLSFPLQHFFMNSAPWMSNAMYLLQGSAVALTAVIVYLVYVRQPGRPDVRTAANGRSQHDVEAPGAETRVPRIG